MARWAGEHAVRLFWAGAMALHGLALDAAEPARVTPCVIIDLNASYTYPSLEPKILANRTITGERGSMTPILIVPRASPPVASTKKQAASKQATAPAVQAKTPIENLMEAIERGDLHGIERLLSTGVLGNYPGGAKWGAGDHARAYWLRRAIATGKRDCQEWWRPDARLGRDGITCGFAQHEG